MMADVKLSENSAQWNMAKRIAKHYPSFLLLAILFYRCFLFILQLCCQDVWRTTLTPGLVQFLPAGHVGNLHIPRIGRRSMKSWIWPSMSSLPSPQNSVWWLSDLHLAAFMMIYVWSGSMSIAHYPKMKKTTLSGSYRTISSYIVSSH